MIYLLFIAVLPAILIGLYVYNKDKNKEPKNLLVRLFASGIASCFLVWFVSEFLKKIFPFLDVNIKTGTFFEVFIYSFITVALVEEGCKLLMTYLFAYKHKEFDEIYDIIVYSVFVALGFAAFENILYVFTNASLGIGLQVGILRGLLSVPGHACDGLFMGYYLSLAKLAQMQNQQSIAKKNFIKSLLVPTILHGIYDFCCMAGHPIFYIVFLIFVIGMYITAIKRLKYVATNNSSLVTTPKFCGNCGAPAQGLFCGHCGHKI